MIYESACVGSYMLHKNRKKYDTRKNPGISLCFWLFFFFSKNLTVAVCSEGLVILGFPLHDRRGFSFQHPPAAEATVVI